MDPLTQQRLFGVTHAFDHAATVGITAVVAGALIIAPLAIMACDKAGKIGDDQRTELWARYKTWLLLVALMLGPVLLGAGATLIAVTVLALLCYREFARVTGLFREKRMTLIVTLGIFAVMFAAADHWYALFTGLGPFVMVILAGAAVFQDEPKGYIQRVGLALFGFALFGLCLGHLAYFANDAQYRPLLMGLVLCVETNDIFAYISGKLFGKRKLAPNTSPNKTLAGGIGAILLTTLLVIALAYGFVPDEDADLLNLPVLIALGIIISVGGQMGDLMLSSIKRDIGIKDTGTTLPGHGGLLDRFDSLLLVAPAVFHFVQFWRGESVGLDQPIRIITSTWFGS